MTVCKSCGSESPRYKLASGRCTDCLTRLATQAANEEVQRHLAAGREVYGRRDGEPVVIYPDNPCIELSNN